VEPQHTPSDEEVRQFVDSLFVEDEPVDEPPTKKQKPDDPGSADSSSQAVANS
jgi:hypothetical protein